MKGIHRFLIIAILLLSIGVNAREKQEEGLFAIAVHGGAGTILKGKITPEEETAIREKLKEALTAGHRILAKGGSSLDAVEAAIVILEDSPLFNAGKGAVFTHEGTNEMDASIMDGSSMNAGGVAGVTTVRNPIKAARKVMEVSPHVILSGAGADSYAKEQGLKIEKPAYFQTPLQRERLQDAIERAKRRGDQGSQAPDPQTLRDRIGTVGAVALDLHGNLAAGTSTGGMTNKRFGRIGDSPIVGAGTYARNDTCAVSCTGHGEYFIRLAVAHEVSARMKLAGESLTEAAHAVIFDELLPIGGRGGLIAIDQKGNITALYNTPGMYRGWMPADGTAQIHIWED